MFTKEFISICKDYAQSREHVLDEAVTDTKKVCRYTIRFYSHAIEFRYVKKESVYFKPSSLYCVVYLNKNSVAYYHLPDLIPFLGRQTFQPCYFWCIENIERLHSCFESLLDILETVTSQLSICLSQEATLSESLFSSYRKIFGLKEQDLDFSKIEYPEDYSKTYFLSLQSMRDGYLFSRYCNFAPYALLLKNKVDKAIKKYEQLNQKGKLFEYEKCLLNYIASSGSEFYGFKPSCNSSHMESNIMTPLKGLKSFLIVYSIASVFFCSCFAIYNAIISIDTLAVLAVPWYMGFLCAGFCSIFGTIAITSLVPIPSKNISMEDQKRMLKILVSKGLRKFILIAFAGSVAVSIFFAVMMMSSNVRFYDDHIAFNSKSYSYENVDSVYYISARYNVYGDRVNYGSYVILFDDETSLDLYGSASIKETELDVLPILNDEGFDVKFADSERELPWYSVE